MRPVDLGYTMPAEWAPHARCWMAWPKRVELWREHLEAAREDYVRVARAIARFEPLTMIADPDQAADARRRCGSSVSVVSLPIDDSWLRDSAPTFLVNAEGGRAAAAFTFNAWGNKYRPHDKDAALGERIAGLAELPVFRSNSSSRAAGFSRMVKGTLITAETCVLNPNRNPGWSKAEAEAELRATLGVRKVIWLPGDVEDTETDGHVDGYVAYFKPAAVLCEVVADPADPRFPIMAENRKVLQTRDGCPRASIRGNSDCRSAALRRSGRRAGLLPLLRQLLYRQWSRDCSRVRDYRGCGGHRNATHVLTRLDRSYRFR